MSPRKRRPHRNTEKPSEAFRRQVASTRQAKRWSQRKLAEQLTELGMPTDQTTVAKTEKPDGRGIGLDELFAYAAALEVAPLHLVVPREDDSDLTLVGRLNVTSSEARRWFVGQQPLKGQEKRFYQVEVAEEEWRLAGATDAWHLRMVIGPLMNARATGDHRAAKRALERVQRALDAIRDEIEVEEAKDEEERG